MQSRPSPPRYARAVLCIALVPASNIDYKLDSGLVRSINLRYDVLHGAFLRVLLIHPAQEQRYYRGRASAMSPDFGRNGLAPAR